MIFVSESEKRALDFAVKHVKRLRPGQRVTLHRSVLEDIGRMEHNGHTWTPPDRVLENIVGSSYEFRWFWGDYAGDRVTFERLEQPAANGYRSYVSPDRRHLYTDIGGVWMPKQQAKAESTN